MDKCQRCKSKSVTLTCLDCESFQSLCTQCDNYLHTLPTKKNHKRLPNESLQQAARKLNNQSQSQSNYDFPQQFQQQCENEQEASFTKHQSNQSDVIIHTNNNVNTIPNLNPNQNMNLTSTSFDSKFFYSNNYSKDYLNEIKSVFQKEKSELEFKNSTLQTNLDRLKLSFAEQMNSLTSQLEDIQNKHIVTVKAIQSNSDLQINEVLNQKNAEIDQLTQKLNEASQANESLSNQRREDNEISNRKLIELNDKITHLQLIIEKKDNELLKLKCSFDTMMTQNESLIGDQRKAIINEYETKVNSIINDFEEAKEKLMKVVAEREVDIKNIIEVNRTEGNDYALVISKLQKEVECHKANIIKLRDERDYLKEQNNILINKENGYLCNGQSQDFEIRRLMEENQRLLNENDEVKIQLSKLDKLIYGKIRANNFK